MYILQQTLFSFEELMELELKERLHLFFSNLSLEPYAVELRNQLPQGAKGFSRTAILRALLAAPFVGISTFTGLVDRLKSDIRFRYQCGFGVGISEDNNLKFGGRNFHSLGKRLPQKRNYQRRSDCY